MLSDDEAAAYATVMLFADSNTTATPIAYAITDNKGHFSIKATPKTGNWLAVRYLGYKEHRQPIIPSTKSYTIKLKVDAQRLNAVKVEAEYKSVEVIGDTIRFNTEYFKTGTEDNAAEVLNKIPGMEVDDNGDVSYGGKKVDRITIDGRDMFSSGSDGALNTLSADAIKGAEILQNSRSNSIIDNFTGRDFTTLNLKTDGRARANGKVSAYGGIQNKFKSENSLLIIGKKLSLTAIASGNNTGEAVFSFNDYIQHIVGLDNLLSSLGNGFKLSEDEIALLMPPGNVYQSRNGVATLSGNWQPSEKFKMKGNLILNATGLDAESLSQLQYISLGFTDFHATENHDRNLFFTGQMQQTWTPNEDVEFSNHTRIVRSRHESDDSLSESGFNNLRVDENNQLNKVSFNEEMVLNIKRGNSMYSTHLNMTHTQRNYCYDMLTDQAVLPFTFYQLSGSDYHIDTHKEIQEFEFAPDFTYALQIGHKYTLNATVGFLHKSSKLHYGLQPADSITAEILYNDIVTHISFNKTKGLLRFTLGAEMFYEKWSSSIAAMAGNQGFTILPSGSLTLHFSSTHQLSLNASIAEEYIGLEYLVRDPMVTGYNSIYNGSEVTDPINRNRNVSLNYYIYDLFSNTLFFAGAGITDNSMTLKPYATQDSNTVSFTVYNNDGTASTRYISSHISKGLGSLPIDAKLFATLSQSDSKTTINHVDGSISLVSYSTSLALVSRSKKVLNGDVGISYQSSRSELQTIATIKSQLNQYEGHAALMVTFKKFNGEIRYTFTHLENGSYTRDFHDLGFRMEYRMGQWRMLLRGSNILNIDKMDWLAVSSTPFTVNTVTYRKIPGYLLGGVAFRF